MCYLKVLCSCVLYDAERILYVYIHTVYWSIAARSWIKYVVSKFLVHFLGIYDNLGIVQSLMQNL